MAFGGLDVDPGQQRAARIPGGEPPLNSPELAGRATVGPDHEMLAVARVAPVGRIGKDDVALPGRPADVIKMQVGEDDVGDVFWHDAVRGQALQKLTTDEWP